MKRMSIAVAFALLLSGAARAEPKFPHLEAAEKAIAVAQKQVNDAREYHKDKGTLGGHGTKAEHHLAEALKEIREAVTFAETHHSNEHKTGK